MSLDHETKALADGYAAALADMLVDALDRIAETEDYKRTEYIVARGLHEEGNDYDDMLWRILKHLELANRELTDEVLAS